jgi:hypothetical protein
MPEHAHLIRRLALHAAVILASWGAAGAARAAGPSLVQGWAESLGWWLDLLTWR